MMSPGAGRRAPGEKAGRRPAIFRQDGAAGQVILLDSSAVSALNGGGRARLCLASRTHAMKRIRRTLVSTLLLLVAVSTLCQAQTAIRLQWELQGDVFKDARDRGASRLSFTLTNEDTKPLLSKGWAIYFNALHTRIPGSEKGGVVIEHVISELFRMVPTSSFAGLQPGQSARIEYLAGLVGNISQAPAGPYIVFDEAPDKGHPLREYVALPFERPSQQGRDPRVVTPEALFDRNVAIQDLPADSLPPVFPTPQTLEMKEGVLHLDGLPVVFAPPELSAEAALAAKYLQPRFAGAVDKARTLKLEIGKVEGWKSPEAYQLSVDPGGIHIVGNAPVGVFYGLQSLRSLLPAPPGKRGLDL
ncbi:MAG: hypothetical protein EHM13_15170, partial [Acidobacteria bacterium]